MTNTPGRHSPTDLNQQTSVWIAAMPAPFVMLWSSGFVGTKYGLPYVEPLTFLS